MPSEVPEGGKKVVCYYSSWAFYRPGYGKFDIEDIDPHICTHLNYGWDFSLFTLYFIMNLLSRFANMNNVTWEIVAYDPWFDLGEKNIIP